MNIDMLTPKQAARCVGEINKRWVSKREEFIKGKQDIA